MYLLGTLITIFLLAAFVSYVRTSFWTFLAGSLIVVACMQSLSVLPGVVAGAFYIIFAGLAVIMLFKPQRKQLITKPIFGILKKSLPTISKTEQEALDSGRVWWEADLFKGEPNWEKFNKIRLPELNAEELRFVENETDNLCSMLDDWKITSELYDLPKEAWDYLKDKGFFGLIIPKEYGGKEFSPIANSTIVQKVAARSLTAAVSIMVPNSLGPAELLLHYGTEEQKNYYLPKLADGREIPCFALTSPTAGSDATSLRDTGVVTRGVYQGEECLGIRLNWDKRYITLAPIATVLGLAFRLEDPDGLLGEQEDLGITVCLLPTNLEGIEIGNRHFPLNLTFMNGPTRGKDVFVPIDFIIGGKEMAGKGWRMLVECLATGRGISLPALSAAAGKHGYLTTCSYAKVRTQFNMSIGQFEGIKEVLARIAGMAYRLEAMRLFTIAAIDGCEKPSVVTAIAKYHMTEMGRDVISDSMDIHAGRGIIMGPRNYLARAYQGLPVSITVEGANILTRTMIIFGQGAIRCHPYIQDEIKAANNEDYKDGLDKFDKALFSHIGYVARNMCRLVFHGFTAGKLIKVSGKKDRGVKRYYQQIERMSIALSMISELSLSTLGGKLKRMEILSAKLGDILSHLFMAAATLKLFEESGNEEEKVFMDWAVQDSMYSVGKQIESVLRNFPIPFVGWIYRHLLVFPFGNPYLPPKDSLSIKLANMTQKDSSLRDKWKKLCYFNDSPSDPCGRIENAFKLSLAVDPIMQKINKARKDGRLDKSPITEELVNKAMELGIVNQDEAQLFSQYEAAKLDAINVDEFANLKDVFKSDPVIKQESCA